MASSSSSGSGLTFKLHPLVIVNISDHHTRTKSQAQHQPYTSSDDPQSTFSSNGAVAAPPPPPPRVFGCVVGVQRGRTVEIFNSFELVFDPATNSLDRAYLLKKQELYKKVFPDFYVLGWYATGSDAEESDMQIHRALMDINESPVYVVLNPAINHAQKDLPITIYESDGGSAATQLAAHLTGIHSAIKMLNSRIRILHQYLTAVQRGDMPLDNSLVRQVSSLLRRLPAIESEKFQDDFLMEFNDTLLITYLAMFTNCASTMNDLVDKFSTAYDRHSRRGGRTAFI